MSKKEREMGYQLIKGADRKFAIGHRYQTETVGDPGEYLEAVLRTDRYLRKSMKESNDGITWTNNKKSWRMVEIGEADQSFYSGSTGILYFYLKLFDVTGNPEHLRIVKEGARYLARHWREFFKQTPVFGDMNLKGSENGLYFGVAGIGMILAEVYADIKDENAKAGALEVVDYLLEVAVNDEEGVYWNGPTGMAMDGGIILMLMRAYRIFGEERIKEAILKAAERYLNQGDETADGALEFNGCKEFGIPTSWPNYEFGTAGAGFLLTEIYDFTKDKRFLEAAERCTLYLKTIQVPQKKGYLIPHDVGGSEKTEPVFFLSSCHGPGGNAKLYYRLYEITGDKKWLDEITQMVDGIESTGAPEIQSIGLWNTLCYCCGHAGLIQFFLGLYHGLGDERYLNLARRTASVIMGEREDHDDGTTSWPMAFWRLKPEFLTEDIGYFDGCAGIASALLQIYLQEKGQFKWHRLPDDPFPEQ